MTTFKDIDPKGFLLNDNDTGVDHLGESTFADAIAESVHTVDTPITIGLLARWGSGKSFLLRHVESLLKRYQKQTEIDNQKVQRRDKCPCSKSCFFWVLCVVLGFVLILSTLFFAIMPELIIPTFESDVAVTNTTANATNVTQTTPNNDRPQNIAPTVKIICLILLPLEILFVFLAGCCGNSWLSLNYYGSCRLLTYGAFTKLPIRNPRDDIVQDPGSHPAQSLKHIKPGDERLVLAAADAELFPRRYIFVDFKAWEYAGSDTLWAAIVTKITDAVEEEFGVITARIFRMLTIEEIPRRILRSDSTTVYITLEGGCEDDEVLDMMCQYGVVEDCAKVNHKTIGERCYRVQYSSDGECRRAKECLAIEGVDYYDDDPNVVELKPKPSLFQRIHSARGSKKKLINKRDGVEMKPLRQGKIDSEQQEVVLNNLTRPSRGFCCNRFFSHCIQYPTKLLCLPRLVWWILIFLCSICIPIIAYLVADYLHLDLYRTYRAVPVAGQILLWMPAGIAVSAFTCKFIWAMFHSQRRRINAALDGTRSNMAEKLGFMSKVKNEIEVVSKLVQCARFTHQRDYKIVITVDDLDRVPILKIKSVLEAVSILLSDKSSPFICFVAVDPRVVAKCIEEGMGEFIREGKISGHEYLKKIINLPVCLPEINNSSKKRFIAGLIDQADHTVTYRQVEEKSKYRTPDRGNGSIPQLKKAMREKAMAAKNNGVETVDNVDEHDAEGNSNGFPKVTKISNPYSNKTADFISLAIREEPKRKATEPVIELDHKKFLFQCRKFIYHDEELHKHIQGNPRNMKRLFNVISLTASIINSFLKKQRRREFIQTHATEEHIQRHPYENPDKIERTQQLAEDLVRWLILADQWPYRTSYILQVMEDAQQRKDAGLANEAIPDNWTIFEIFQGKVKEECEKGDGKLLSLDADPDLFYSYIRLLGKSDFTTQRILRLQRFTVNLDFSIQHSISFQRDLSVLTPNTSKTQQTTGNQDTQTKIVKSVVKTPPEIVVEQNVVNHLHQLESEYKRYSLPVLLHHNTALEEV